jgi:hypothetical protein
MDPIHAVAFSLGGTFCGVISGVITVLLLSLVIGKKKVKSLGDATANLADNTMAFSRTVSHMGDRVVRLGASAKGGVQATPVASLGVVLDGDDDEDTLLLRSGTARLMADADGDAVWCFDTSEYDVPKALYKDDFGPLEPADLAAFVMHVHKVDQCCGLNPTGLPELLQGFGYTDVGHWKRVYHSFMKRHGVGQGSVYDMEWGQSYVDAFTSAAFQDSREQMGQQVAELREGGVLDPIEGVTCEAYAAIAAQHAQGLDQEAFTKMLADNDMDQAKYDRVAEAWQDRMANDTSFAVATIYGAAFAGAGTGKYGAAGAAAGEVAMGGDGQMGFMAEQGAAGEAPVTLDKYAEIMGAQEAWSSQGKDVNAMLKEVFDMTALDWSNISAWWFTHLQANVAGFQEAMNKTEQYAIQYGKVTGADKDIEF